MRYDHSPLHTASFYSFLPRAGVSAAEKKQSKKNEREKEPKKETAKARSLKREIEHHGPRGPHFDDLLEDRIGLVRKYLDKGFSTYPQPVMVYEAKAYGHLSLDVLGTSKSIADAMSIETAFAILADEYPEGELLLELNSIGDRESIARFNREVQNYYRKHWAQVPKDSRLNLKKNIFNAFDEKNKEMHDLQENGPKSIGCLSESSRKHLKEVLEYIETLHIPYIINHNLIASPSWMNDTVMQICHVNDKGTTLKVLACGGRYNSLAKKVFGKKEVPSFGIDLALKSSLKEGAKIIYKLFFIQLSFEAKLKSLHVMEILRKSNIPVYQSLSKDKLTSQLGQAEKMNVPFVLLMGKKEALEDSVVVRDTVTRCQETIPIKDLVAYLKKIL